jgi:hypothetical protein
MHKFQNDPLPNMAMDKCRVLPVAGMINSSFETTAFFLMATVITEARHYSWGPDNYTQD